jgi:glycosyltransferase involved in cell wall biosynthesis
MVSLYSAMAADRVVFNSRYNQEGFLAGCDALLNKLPDKVPTGIVQALRRKASVIPVPLCHDSGPVREDASVWGALQAQMPRRDLHLLWVGRFEYDKGGDQLLLCLRELESRGLSYQLAVVGQQFRSSPAAFSTIENEFKHRLVQFGYLEDRRQYLATLAAADIVLSTALHEFQGLAVLEAVAAGALPAVPADLVYPEILPARNCYRTHPDEPGQQADAAADLIVELARQVEEGVADLPDVTRFSSASLVPEYRELFHSLSQWRQ